MKADGYQEFNRPESGRTEKDKKAIVETVNDSVEDSADCEEIGVGMDRETKTELKTEIVAGAVTETEVEQAETEFQDPQLESPDAGILGILFKEYMERGVKVALNGSPSEALHAFFADLIRNPAMDYFVQKEPRFAVNRNVLKLLEEVESLKGTTPASSEDLIAVRATVDKIWTHLEQQSDGAINPATEEAKGEALSEASSALIQETRTLIRSVNDELNSTRSSIIQLTNQNRIALDAAARTLREMDITLAKYEEESELRDALGSLRDMMATHFENAKLEPIEPEVGASFNYAEHRADAGSSASNKIKRTLYSGFRWTQPNPPVVILHALVETE